jgi:hypothetical protein|nr:MAG TPA: hypothetical protein [Caudoviricetes sp.]
MKTLITDRTELDVIEAKKNPSATDYKKGNYNFTDLNRLEEWCSYLQKKFNDNGYKLTLNLKLKYYTYEELKKFKYSDLKEMLFIELKHGNWGMTDIPTLSEINRIRDNIQTLKNNLMTRSTLTIIKNNTMNYNQANILEQILLELDELFTLYEKSLRYCGTFYCGEE